MARKAGISTTGLPQQSLSGAFVLWGDIMKKKESSSRISSKELSTSNLKDQHTYLTDPFIKDWVRAEAISRLSKADFLKEFKKHFKIATLGEFGSDCYDLLEAFSQALKGEVNRAMQKALETKSPRELKLLRNKIEDYSQVNGRIRESLKHQEALMRSLLNGVDRLLKGMNVKPESVFYRPKQEDVVENVICPQCGENNKAFKYEEPCRYCHERIGNPWKEHTICPECDKIINRSDIFGDKEAHELDTTRNLITCPYCDHRFDWKKHRREPEKFTHKVCIHCDRPFIPNKRNWTRQRICQNCRKKGVDSFHLDKPDYYRNRQKKK
jgi:hypothetical protein